jgi:hypothetical protein
LKRKRESSGSTTGTSRRWSISTDSFRYLVSFILLAVCPVCFGLTEVYLRDGSILKGNLLAQSNGRLELDVNFSLLSIPMAEIDKVINLPDQSVSIMARDGVRHEGLFIYQDFEKMKLSVPGKGEEIIYKTNIRNLEWRNSNSRPDPVAAPGSSSDFLMLKVYWQSGWRSMILPSWGQFHKGQKLKGALIAGFEVSSVVLFAVGRLAYLRASAAYNDQPTLSGLKKRNGWQQTEQVSAGLFLIIYGLNVLDAFFADPGRPVLPVPLQSSLPDPGLVLRISF